MATLMGNDLCYAWVLLPSHIPFAFLFFLGRDGCSFIPGWEEPDLVYLIKEPASSLCAKHQTQTQTLQHTPLSWGIFTTPRTAPALYSFPSKIFEF